MGFLELLTILFIALKLFEVIDWSWWLVFSPMYVYIIAFFTAVAFAFVKVIAEDVEKRKRRKK